MHIAHTHTYEHRKNGLTENRSFNIRYVHVECMPFRVKHAEQNERGSGINTRFQEKTD